MRFFFKTHALERVKLYVDGTVTEIRYLKCEILPMFGYLERDVFISTRFIIELIIIDGIR